MWEESKTKETGDTTRTEKRLLAPVNNKGEGTQETKGNDRNHTGSCERKRGRTKGGSRGRLGREPAKRKWR